MRIRVSHETRYFYNTPPTGVVHAASHAAQP